jgi:hypothetical protein
VVAVPLQSAEALDILRVLRLRRVVEGAGDNQRAHQACTRRSQTQGKRREIDYVFGILSFLRRDLNSMRFLRDVGIPI